ncbi:vacuolar amino acid permease [Pluteus cervinus]|uniref:Vacuolar amino acid permease n=1 Tax=Pluteus cervinus TaxID=181527 RepID=A0ACD3AII3_9AGAR|nr:vacuolar amino acid permease [Pluteus cervinus]
MTEERRPLLQATRGYDGVKDDESDSSTQQNGPLDISAAMRRRILAGIWLAQFLSALNLTLVPTMLPSISSEFQKSNQASWIGTAYLLATCTFTPLYGRLSDVLGRRGASLSAASFASIGILSCGLSRSMESLIASRFFSGLGGGGIFTTAAIITSDMYGMRSRGFIQSLGGIFYGLGMGLGGPFGGLMTDHFGWRSAFFIQLPFFGLALALIFTNLRYTTPGSGRNTTDILKRIDYGGSITLLGMVGSVLAFLSARYHDGQEWCEPIVWIPCTLACVFGLLFLCVEFFVAVEPILPPLLITEKVPVLVGCSNALVAICNLSVTYYFPVWFQTVMLSSASTAGLHLLPNSVCISTGSVFAGWVIRRTGRYKTMNMIFGCLPFLAALMLTRLREDSGPILKWFCIMPLGFGNAIVLQTMYIALVSNLPESQLAVGTGFAQLLRGLGQVGGLALASAVFQSRLDSELRHRIHGPQADELVHAIRHSVSLLQTLPPDLQRIARDSYAASLRSVFILAACASLLAYIARVPIPDKQLEDHQPSRTPPPELEEDEVDQNTVRRDQDEAKSVLSRG